MFWIKKYNLRKEKKENEEKLRKLHGREVKYASERDIITNIEKVIGKNGIIDITDDVFSVICNNNVIFSSVIQDLWGSDLMSLDGIILTYKNKETGADVEIIVYYKYYREVKE